MNQSSPTALITGASSGIGWSLAELLARKGYNLILMARREKPLLELKEKIQKENSNIKIVICVSDVSEFEKHMADVKKSAAEFDSLDLVIANSGVGYVTSEWENTWEQSLKTINTNVLGAIATLESAKDIMLKQGYGHLVGVTSVAAMRGLPQSSAYCASKSAFATFMEAMRVDLLGHNISVTAIHPGFITTPMTEKNGYMPFLLNADTAALKMFRAIQRKKARFYFPWQMRIVYTLSSYLPDFIYDLLMRFGKSRVKAFKQDRE